MSILDSVRRSVKPNVGGKDQIIRAVIGVLIAVMVLFNIIPIRGWIGLVPVIVVVYLLGTSGLGFDPVYRAFRISTVKVPNKPD